MYLNILRRDLKRKKTMNVILLLFIILASMFVSSSVNNIATISTALDGYFDRAGMTDYYVGTRYTAAGAGAGDKTLKETIDAIDSVTSCHVEPYFAACGNQLSIDGEPLKLSTGTLSCFAYSGIRFFDVDNEVLADVKPGEFYTIQSILDQLDISVGDVMTVRVGETERQLRLAGTIKDAFLGPEMMSMSRFLLSKEDFDAIAADETATPYMCSFVFINTTDETELEAQLNKADAFNIVFMGNRKLIETSYIMDMIIAGVLLIVSACLVLIAFVMLRFTISFTLEEEFREIGVMKAIGLRNTRIRGLYLIKYFSISVVGAVLGLLAGIPFGNLLLARVSEKVVMENESGYLINAVCAALVVGIVVLFCFGCTRKVNHYTPVDAIRSGATGERFRRKSILTLSKGHLRPIGFLALNDILSHVKRYAIMMLTFALGLSLIAIVANTANTLKSRELLGWFSLHDSDLVVCASDYADILSSDGDTVLRTRLDAMEAELQDAGLPAHCSTDIYFKLSLQKGDKTSKSIVMQGVRTKTDEYPYLEGTAPAYPNEIAVTPLIAEQLDAQIGDTVQMTDLDGTHEYVITALFQSMSNMGEGVRLHEDVKINYAQAMGAADYQINFNDSPNASEIEDRKPDLQKLYPDAKIFNGGEYVDYMIGGIAETIDGVKFLVLPVVLIICILVVVLMERSFITKEKSEIALLKAIGFRSRSVIAMHTLRVAVVMLCAVGLAALVSTPLSQISSGQIFQMMGAQYITFVIRPLEVFVLYPLILLGGTLLAVLLTAQYTRTISAAETSNIE